jgi:hypothetical protein
VRIHRILPTKAIYVVLSMVLLDMWTEKFLSALTPDPSPIIGRGENPNLQSDKE